MTQAKSTGACGLCRKKFARPSMGRHLKSCREKHRKSPAKNAAETSLHLFVEARYESCYWLHLEADANLALGDLDGFLRDLWLECCGHMSGFEPTRSRQRVQTADAGDLAGMLMPIGLRGEDLFDDEMDEFGNLEMETPLRSAFPLKGRVNYTYDFGSSTELVVTSKDEIDKPLAILGEIKLLARNDPPHITCGRCQKKAAVVCTECRWDDDGWLCKKCSRSHECGDELFLPVVNSPRVGECAYMG